MLCRSSQQCFFSTSAIPFLTKPDLSDRWIHDPPESQVDPWSNIFSGLGNPVLPSRLQISFHDQKGSMFQPHRIFFMVILFFSNVKTSDCAKGNRSYNGVRSHYRFFITVPGNRIPAVTVIIEQYTVEAYARNRLYQFLSSKSDAVQSIGMDLPRAP